MIHYRFARCRVNSGGFVKRVCSLLFGTCYSSWQKKLKSMCAIPAVMRFSRGSIQNQTMACLSEDHCAGEQAVSARPGAAGTETLDAPVNYPVLFRSLTLAAWGGGQGMAGLPGSPTGLADPATVFEDAPQRSQSPQAFDPARPVSRFDGPVATRRRLRLHTLAFASECRPSYRARCTSLDV